MLDHRDRGISRRKWRNFRTQNTSLDGEREGGRFCLYPLLLEEGESLTPRMRDSRKTSVTDTITTDTMCAGGHKNTDKQDKKKA